jgi:putative FmdB family regulatory protein
MPLFDFVCRACRTEFESLVRTGSADPACPQCGSTDLERQLPSFAVKSAERTQAFAAANRRRHASQAERETLAQEREAEKHRKEDH